MTEFPAPVRGWVTNRNIARNQRDAALVLENCFPEQDRVRIRKGWKEHNALGSKITGLLTYDSGVISEFFAVSGNSVWDVTTAGRPIQISSVSQAISSETVHSAQFRTPGGHYLYALNGVNFPFLYDGTAWVQVTPVSSPISLTGVDANQLIYPFAHKERLFFIEKDSLKAWYLPVKSVGGALSDLDLSSVFRRGGKLLMGGTYSTDAGDGVDDFCAFVSTNGEVAVYQGSNPGDANAWALVGLFEIGEPLGADAWIRAGGDWVIATTEGMVPLSAVFTRDRAALSLASISRAIESEWAREVRNRVGSTWRCAKWDQANMAMVSMEVAETSQLTPAQVFVVNVETGAWAPWPGPNVGLLAVFQGRLYGVANDVIMEAEAASSDVGELYTARLAWWPDDLGGGANIKRVIKARGTFVAQTTFAPKVSVGVNYSLDFPTQPSASALSGVDTWDAGIWDTAVWGGARPEYRRTRWKTISRTGFAVSPQVQVTIGGGAPPEIDVVALDVLHETGGAVV
ncbi:MAG: hypothetical protein AAF762_00245 [Pseudomonadota bacterium]